MLARLQYFFIRLLRRAYYLGLSLYYHHSQDHIKRQIKHSGKANICFIVSSLPMWRLQDLFDILSEDSHFKAWILLAPFSSWDLEHQKYCIKELQDYFDKRGCHYQLFDTHSIDSIWNDNEPDIIFYQQMYADLYPHPIGINYNLGKLFCYIPYGMMTIKGEWIYNTKYTNLAWKLFYPTTIHAEYARKHSFNSAKNVSVVGEPHARLFSMNNYSYPWKHQRNPETKKVIWAPHFSIQGTGYLHRGSFLWLSEIMTELAKTYEGQIQFVFKPHPRLISELYTHPDWGKEKTDCFIEKWKNGVNTQVETGEYIDLFMTSDAMIHDCGSFTAEYLYTHKPVLFSSRYINDVKVSLDSFGAMCLDLHYQGSSKEEIVSFLEDVVLKGNDYLLADRQHFYTEVLEKDAKKDVGKSIYNIIEQELF